VLAAAEAVVAVEEAPEAVAVTKDTEA